MSKIYYDVQAGAPHECEPRRQTLRQLRFMCLSGQRGAKQESGFQRKVGGSQVDEKEQTQGEQILTVSPDTVGHRRSVTRLPWISPCLVFHLCYDAEQVFSL